MTIRIKVDEDLPGEITVLLRASGHDVLSVLDEGLGGEPVTHERLEARRLAHQDGQWVREALNAAAAKRPIPMPTSN